jgi:biopolymer transport protein ExbD
MNLRPRTTPDPDINLAPLIDVVFLLLIFFMVSTTFKDDVRLQVKLPQASGEPVPANAPEMLEVVIDREGRFYVNQEQVVDQTVETLKRALSGALAARDAGFDSGTVPTGQNLPLLIKADGQTPHQAVITLMDAASQLGLVRIAFAAAQTSSDPASSIQPAAATGLAP